MSSAASSSLLENGAGGSAKDGATFGWGSQAVSSSLKGRFF